MPTQEQLAQLPVAADGDGSSSESNVDGSTTTSWPDGTVRVDYQDGSLTVTFSDFAVLNVAADGTRTLNDKDGKPLDPVSGQPLQGADGGELPTQSSFGPDYVKELIDGREEIANLSEALEAVETLDDALEGEIDPTKWATKVFVAIVETIKATETEERGVRLRAWCYAVLYGALDMGTPPDPVFKGSDLGEEQDQLDQTAWGEGVAAGQADLVDGTDGVALRNKLLLRVAHDGSQPQTTLNALWKAACEKTDDDKLLGSYPSLSWPQPLGA